MERQFLIALAVITSEPILSRIRQHDHSDIAVFDIDDVDDRDTITTDDEISDLCP